MVVVVVLKFLGYLFFLIDVGLWCGRRKGCKGYSEMRFQRSVSDLMYSL